jgi:hypothetical protein
MPRYLSEHALACMTRQAATALLQRMAAEQGTVRLRRALWNFQEGRMVAELEASSLEEARRWLEGQGLSYRWLMRVEYESADGDLHPA